MATRPSKSAGRLFILVGELLPLCARLGNDVSGSDCGDTLLLPISVTAVSGREGVAAYHVEDADGIKRL